MGLVASLELQASAWLKAPSSCRRRWIRLHSWRRLWKICSVGAKRQDTRSKKTLKSIQPGFCKQRSTQLQQLTIAWTVHESKHLLFTQHYNSVGVLNFTSHEVRWGFSQQHWGTNTELTSGVLLLCPHSLTFTSFLESSHQAWSNHSHILFLIFCSPLFTAAAFQKSVICLELKVDFKSLNLPCFSFLHLFIQFSIITPFLSSLMPVLCGYYIETIRAKWERKED